jgi:UDP-N-acetylmuramoylalanine--D-glutamate ligase
LGGDEKKYGSFSIIGAARSGVALTRFLRSRGYRVFLSDMNSVEKIKPDFVREIKSSGAEYEFGKHSEKVYESDVMVVSPGVPQNSEVIKKALARGKEVVSELEAASWFCKGKIISITGTNGKTTTTTLAGKIFEDAGFKTFVCGNIGRAFSNVVGEIGEDGVAVVETSSFQLDNITKFKPYVSVLLNITPDHLDRYDKSYENYINSKFRVTENQDSGDYLIFNYDDEVIRSNVEKKTKARMAAFSIKQDISDKYELSASLKNEYILYCYSNGREQIINTKRLLIKGFHNIYNSMASVLSAKIFGINNESIAGTLYAFEGVEHRLELVRELKGVKFYNDSKATNVNSVWYALQGFDEPVVLILGGQDKGNDYSEIEKEVSKHVRHIIAVGESKMKVFDHFKSIVSVTLADDMTDAVKKGYSNAGKNSIVLLSPACASFDMFENYEHRGREFKRIVYEL